MFKRTMMAMLVLALAVTPTVMAQDTTDTAPAAKPKKSACITTAIPADCMGFMASGNLEKSMDNLQIFLGAMGLGDTVEGFAPMGVLPMISMMLGMGEGFNPNGGFGVVMVDPKKVGCDDMSTMTAANSPLVFLIAGSDAESTFAGAVFSEDGTTFELMSVGKMYFKQLGDYVAFTTNPDALKLMDTTKTVKLSASQAKVLKSSDMVLFVNWPVVAPLALKAIDDAEKDIKAGADGENVELMDFNFNFSKKQIENIEGMIVGLNVGKAGMTFDIVLDYKEGSDDAKMLAAMKSLKPIVMDNIPAGKYYVAAGINGMDIMLTQNNVQLQERIDLLADEIDIPEDITLRIKEIVKAVEGNMTGVQFCIGGSEAAELAMVAVMECKDADKMLKLVPKKVELLNEIVEVFVEKADNPKAKALAKKLKDKAVATTQKAGAAADIDEEDIQKLAGMEKAEFKVEKNVATVDGVSFDAIVLDLTEVEEFDDDDRQKLVKLIGEEQIRFLYAKINDNKIITCFGGGEGYLKKAVAAAKGGESLAKNEHIAKAMKIIDGKRMTFAAINVKTVMDIVNKITAKSADADVPQFVFTSDAPIVMGDMITGPRTTTSRIFVPASLFLDFFTILQQNMGGGMMPMPGMGF